MPERVTAVGEATSLADRKRRAGQRLLIGLAGPAVDEDLRALVREVRPAGFILFKRNVVEPAQVLFLVLAPIMLARGDKVGGVDTSDRYVRQGFLVWRPPGGLPLADAAD